MLTFTYVTIMKTNKKRKYYETVVLFFFFMQYQCHQADLFSLEN